MELHFGWPQIAWLVITVAIYAADVVGAKTPELGCLNAILGLCWFVVQFVLLYCGGFFG